MSSLIVEVCKVEEILPIDGADRIERVRVKNWWCVSGKGQYNVGNKVVYLPPDSVISESLADRWGITKFCAKLGKELNGDLIPGLRIKACRFRGVSSFGTIQNPDEDWPIGHDVTEHYKVTKYNPPLKSNDGDADTPVEGFNKYTDVENLGNFPGVLIDEEEVIFTEKLHGSNCRVGFVLNEGVWEWMGGSHSIRRKEFAENNARSRYWMPLSIDPTICPLRKMILQISNLEKASFSVIVYGEIFGKGVQDMQYGQKGLSFRVFDIAVDGQYLDYDKANHYLTEAEIDQVPLLYRGPFSMKKVEEFADGPTTVCDIAEIEQPFKGREGIVVKPTKERFDGSFGGRVILKYISADYHERKNKNRTEDH
jgi:RNA ligase (TIGR02306 family)